MAKDYWLVDFPVSQYKEDVKKLAVANKLSLIDSKFKDLVSPDKIAEDTPKLTKKRNPKQNSEPVKDEQEDDEKPEDDTEKE